MEPRISIITLGVQDLNRSLRFYRDGLGFPTTWTGDKGVIFFQTGATCLALYPFNDLARDVWPGFSSPQPRFGGITLAHNVRTKEEVNRSCFAPRRPAEQSRRRRRMPSGVDITATSPIQMGTFGKSLSAHFQSAPMAAWKSHKVRSISRETSFPTLLVLTLLKGALRFS